MRSNFRRFIFFLSGWWSRSFLFHVRNELSCTFDRIISIDHFIVVAFWCGCCCCCCWCYCWCRAYPLIFRSTAYRNLMPWNGLECMNLSFLMLSNGFRAFSLLLILKLMKFLKQTPYKLNEINFLSVHISIRSQIFSLFIRTIRLKDFCVYAHSIKQFNSLIWITKFFLSQWNQFIDAIWKAVKKNVLIVRKKSLMRKFVIELWPIS